MTDYNDGQWHSWDGGPCPVHKESAVDFVWHDLDGKDAGFIENFNAAFIKWREVIRFRVVEDRPITQSITIIWHKIADMPPPTDRYILLCDARNPYVGSRSAMVDEHGGIDAPDYPPTDLSWWTHWAEYPDPAKLD